MTRYLLCIAGWFQDFYKLRGGVICIKVCGGGGVVCVCFFVCFLFVCFLFCFFALLILSHFS